MKVLTIMAYFLAMVYGFADTSAFYSSRELASSFPYITKQSDLDISMQAVTKNVCSSKEKLTIYRVAQLSTRNVPQNGTFIKHVYYATPEELNFDINTSCQVEYVASEKDASSEAQVIIVDVEDDKRHSIEEFVGENFVIVQGKPSFTKSKRDEFDELMEDVEEDFETAKAMLEAEGDSLVSTMAKSDSNLFTEYQFFTPGIWMTFMVSGFLLFILYTALGWLTSLEVSYKSFEKQVDYEKKTE